MPCAEGQCELHGLMSCVKAKDAEIERLTVLLTASENLKAGYIESTARMVGEKSYMSDEVIPALRAEVELLVSKVELLARPIGMQDVRLVAGEGGLHASDVLSAVNVIMELRARS